MLPPHDDDAAMHEEVRVVLNTDPAASYGTVLHQWRDGQGGVVELPAAKRLAAIYERERRRSGPHPERAEDGSTPTLGLREREASYRW
jgi:hypothetical protein